MKLKLQDLLTNRQKAIDTLVAEAERDTVAFIDRYRETLIEYFDNSDLEALDRFVKNHADDAAQELARGVVNRMNSVAQIEEDFFAALPLDYEGSIVSASEKAEVFFRYLNNMETQYQEYSYAQRDIIRREIRKQLQTGLSRTDMIKAFDDAGGKLKQHAYTMAHTTLSGVSQDYNNLAGINAGLDHAWYTGTLVVNTRPFCRHHLDRAFTREQISKMKNGMIEPVITYCGGYNCRHRWVWIDPSWDDKFKNKLVNDGEMIKIAVSKGVTANVYREKPIRTDKWNEEFNDGSPNRRKTMQSELEAAEAMNKLGYRVKMDLVKNKHGNTADAVLLMNDNEYPLEIYTPSGNLIDRIYDKLKRDQSDHYCVHIRQESETKEVIERMLLWKADKYKKDLTGKMVILIRDYENELTEERLFNLEIKV